MRAASVKLIFQMFWYAVGRKRREKREDENKGCGEWQEDTSTNSEMLSILLNRRD